MRVDTRKLCSDGRRAIIGIAVSFVVPFVIGTVVGVVAPADSGTVAMTVALSLVGWNVFVVTYVVLTAITFGPVDPHEFTVRMTERRTARSRMARRLGRSGDGPTFAIESAAVAFAVVLVLPHINAIRIDDWLLVPLTLSILLSCWALSVISYALHYAEQDLAEPGLEFPGERTNGWADYVYFSIAVATTFGATDVNITTPRMRRVVNLHTVLTFIYNSVIVALLAALLIR